MEMEDVWNQTVIVILVVCVILKWSNWPDVIIIQIEIDWLKMKNETAESNI